MALGSRDNSWGGGGGGGEEASFHLSDLTSHTEMQQSERLVICQS